MRPLRALGLLLSFGLAAGLNHVTKPRALYALSAGARTTSTGSLHLDPGGQRERFELATIHVVDEELPRLFAEPMLVRALWLRSLEQEDAAPDLELFVDLTAFDLKLDAAARDVGVLRGRELPVLATAVAADTRSRVRFRGAEAPSFVAEGQLIIDEAIALGEPSQGYRVEGELRLSLEDGERTRLITGDFNARLLWP
jgi:hypothetical protein